MSSRKYGVDEALAAVLAAATITVPEGDRPKRATRSDKGTVKPTLPKIDEAVWSSYCTESPREVDIPEVAEAGMRRMLRQSARYITWREGVEVKNTVKTLPSETPGNVRVWWQSRPPLEQGARAPRYKGRGAEPRDDGKPFVADDFHVYGKHCIEGTCGQ